MTKLNEQRGSWLRHGLVALLASSLTLGCSFAEGLKHRSAKPERGQPISCASSVVPPLFDLLWAIVGFEATREWSHSTETKLIGIAVTSTAMMSAIYGFGRIKRCKKVNAAAERDQRRSQAPPIPSLPPPAAPDGGAPGSDPPLETTPPIPEQGDSE